MDLWTDIVNYKRERQCCLILLESQNVQKSSRSIMTSAKTMPPMNTISLRLGWSMLWLLSFDKRSSDICVLFLEKTNMVRTSESLFTLFYNSSKQYCWGCSNSFFNFKIILPKRLNQLISILIWSFSKNKQWNLKVTGRSVIDLKKS